MGYEMIEITSDLDSLKNTRQEIKENKEENYGKYCQKVPESPSPSDKRLDDLKQKKAKTESERLEQRKGELERRYGEEVTPNLVKLDDQGYYRKLRLEYYLTEGREYVKGRDIKAINSLTESSGKLFKPDLIRVTMFDQVKALEALKVLQFLDPEKVFTNQDEEIAEYHQFLVNNRHEIKSILGVNIAEDSYPIASINKLLDLTGYKLGCVKKSGKVRTYQLSPLSPEERERRDRILDRWLTRDRAPECQSDNLDRTNNIDLNIYSSVQSTEPSNPQTQQEGAGLSEPCPSPPVRETTGGRKRSNLVTTSESFRRSRIVEWLW